GTGTRGAETIASMIVSSVSMARSVPMSGRDEVSPARPSLSRRTIALAPVTETIRPIETSDAGAVCSVEWVMGTMGIASRHAVVGGSLLFQLLRINKGREPAMQSAG